MIATEVSVETNRDAGMAVREGTERALLDAAGAGFEAMNETIAAEAADTGQLLKSGIPPEPQRDGSVVTGYAADYAPYVDQGTDPHWPPIEPLRGWARRVLGDESAAYAVQRAIAREGTAGVHFVADGVTAIKAHLRARGIAPHIEEVVR